LDFCGRARKKGPLGRPRCRWENNVKMALREIEWSGMGCIDLVQDRGQWKENLTFGFHIMLGYFLIPVRLVACKEGPKSMGRNISETGCLKGPSVFLNRR
jgi:hypothetical protein